MNRITKLILFLSIVMFANNSMAHDIRTDSTKIAQIVNEFCNWYVSSIKKCQNKCDSTNYYMPEFVKTKNGMTSLDFSEYIKNLKKYRFSDSLIMKEKETYSKCIENLKTIKFSDFGKTRFIDLGDYEEACCDFGNRYRWIGGQEPIEGIRIQNIQFISIDTVLVSIEYSELSFDEDLNTEYTYYTKRGNKLILIKQNNDWYIDNIDSFEGENCRKVVQIIEEYK